MPSWVRCGATGGGLLGVLLCLLPVLSHAADPVVRNVEAAQRRDGSQLVDITYDVEDADTDTLTWVKVEASADNGDTWQAITHVSGDVGDDVLVGPGKRIVWDIGAELPDSTGAGWIVQVIADDTPPAPAGMVLIPAGAFPMGDGFAEGDSDERPVHAVYVDAFYMDQYEVSVSHFTGVVTGCRNFT